MTPEIEFTVAATNGKPQRMVVACWNDGVFRARVDVVSAFSRATFFKQLAAKMGADREALQREHEDRLIAEADEADSKAHAKSGSVLEQLGKKESLASQLVELVSDAELWHDRDQESFATVEVEGHHEHWRLRSRQFKTWLARRCHSELQRTPNSNALNDCVLVLEGKARFEGDECAAHLRVAEHDGAIYLDLGDTDWRAVQVGADGWRMVENPPVRFRRAKAMLSLPEPKRGGSFDALRQFVNVQDDAWRLLVAWLVAAIRPKGPYPVLALFAEHGSGKSTAGKLLRSLVDPNTAPLRSEPREPRDLAVSANNGWVVALDNLSYIPPWLSDCICRLATGGGFSTRTLYENDEETIFNATRPVCLTAIDDVATRADLLDRSLIVPLPAIPDANRRTEKQIDAAFALAQPLILGALLDAVSAAQRNLAETKLARLPRMADFAQWVSAAEPALGWTGGTFLDAYASNRDEGNSLALEANPVAKVVVDLATQCGAWQGTPTELLRELDSLASHDPKRVPKGWPASAKSLSGILKRLAPNLRAAGVSVEMWRTAGTGSRRMVAIGKGTDSCVASDACDAPPPTLFTSHDDPPLTPEDQAALDDFNSR